MPLILQLFPTIITAHDPCTSLGWPGWLGDPKPSSNALTAYRELATKPAYFYPAPLNLDAADDYRIDMATRRSGRLGSTVVEQGMTSFPRGSMRLKTVQHLSS